MKLHGKRSLVTGANRGLGKALALGLAGEGAAVAVGYRTHREEAEGVAEQIRSSGGRAVALQGDTSVKAEAERLVEAACEAFGGLDLLVNNAGVLKRTHFLEIPESEWDWIMSVNLKGYFLVSQAAARVMVRQSAGGAILNVSSAGAKLAAPNLAHYNTAKAGVGMLTQAMALELAAWKIRVNAIGPGLIETDLNRGDLQQEEFRNFRLSRIPLKIIGVPEDIVAGSVYLLSDEARLVTGTTLYMDAGQSIW